MILDRYGFVFSFPADFGQASPVIDPSREAPSNLPFQINFPVLIFDRYGVPLPSFCSIYGFASRDPRALDPDRLQQRCRSQ